MADETGMAGLQQTNSVRRGPPEHLKAFCFKPGTSGNPNGKRRGQVSLRAALKKHLIQHPESLRDVVQGVLDKARMGDVSAARLIAELLDELRSGGVNIGVAVNPVPVAESFTRDEIDAILKARFEDLKLIESGAVKLPEPAGAVEPAQASAGAGEPGNSG
ncbi:MAG TPA: DUF5681 domain-containing protein [Verrucomicrobiota bacterium]|nr:DUF5681 domain-containing protein [Verrucomicrobiota bacterium]